MRVARTSRETPEMKFLKNLSKCFSWLKVPPIRSHEGSYKNFCVTLTTGAFTREQVTSLSREKPENPDFWKIFYVFFGIGTMTRQWVAKTYCMSSRLGTYDWTNLWPSRQNRATQFLKILTLFVKTKYFPKTTKTLKKKIFWSTKIKHMKHI